METSNIKNAKNMFPNMPEEVFYVFLAPLIKDIGWPFKSTNDSIEKTDWYRILYPLTLSSLGQLKWQLTTLFMNENILCPLSNRDVKLLIMNKSKNILAFIGRDSKPSRDALANNMKFILATGNFHTPIAIAATTGGFKILDGNHRVAALFDLGLQDKLMVDAWVGTSENI